MRTIALVLWCLGCTPAQSAAWVPALAVRGQLVTRADGLDWRVEGALAFRDRDPVVREEEEASRRSEWTAAPCADPAICAWERRANVEALRRLGRGE